MQASDCCAADGVLIYFCAGGSNVGQLSNAAAIKLDQEGLGRCFCLAGLGGDVEGLVKTAREADCTIAIDGCALQCAKLALQRHGMEPGCYVVVTELGIEKSRNFELSEEQIAQVVEAVKSRRGEAGEGSSDAGCSCCSED